MNIYSFCSMPQKIITLPQELANQIAAGEVVERPLSVVKELFENSVDAGATEVCVVLENGGINLIEIQDNGIWISKQDLPKTFEKYSTSKIASLKDLQEVLTFGFRGEALASISSVSQFSLQSKIDSDISANKIELKNGKLSEITEIAGERGTLIRVENLFYNTPARLNYLKTARTELLKIQDFLQKMALILTEIEVKLIHNEKQVFHFPKDQSLRDRIYSIYGQEFSTNMLELSHEFWWVSISWVVSDPKVSFQNKTKQVIFVNNRLVQSPITSKAIYDAYNRFIPHRTFPGYILSIVLDPTEVDVNVHPRKMELRFASEQTLFRSVYHGVKNILEKVSLVQEPYLSSQGPTLNSPTGQFQDSRVNTSSFVCLPKEKWNKSDERVKGEKQYHTWSGTRFKNYSPYTNTSPNPAQEALEFSKHIIWWKSLAAMRGIKETPIGRIIGQAHNAYILVETGDGIQILDQHALAERVIYEQLSSSSYTPKTQKILWGISLQLDQSEQEVIESYQEVFDEMGFQVDILSHGIVMIHGIPDFLSRENIENSFHAILWDISDIGSRALDEVRCKIWAYTACRSAVKFWDPLSTFEIQALLKDANLDYSSTCPHGRPVVYDIDLESLKGKYER